MDELVAFLFSCALIAVWGLEMFCDSPRLDYFHAIRPTKNMTALTIPSFAFVILVVAAAKTLEKYCGKLPHAVSGRCQWVVAMSSLNASVGVR